MSKGHPLSPDTSITSVSQKRNAPPHSYPTLDTLKLLYNLPCRGELPAVAGFLLYPDTPAKMESTTQRAFCPQPSSRPEKGRALQSNLTLEGDRCFLTTHREYYHPHPQEGAPRALRRRQRGKERQGKKTDKVEDKQSRAEEEKLGVEIGGVCEEREKMLSLYQQDFSLPPIPFRRRSLAFPHPDNIAINPVLRAEFRTVQRDTYPMWSLTEYFKPIARLRAIGQQRTYPG